ncbi:MAG TPA: VWA domain-containing protein [Chloroflexia bacterium]|nr:VWA domain-containing protein [Chloroflexia bacterium]
MRYVKLCLLLVLAAALSPVLAPARASAQTRTREMTVNQIRGYGWPEISLNFNLRSLDNTGLGTLDPSQFIIEENGVEQHVSKVALGHDIGVPLSVVLVIDTSGSMQGDKLAAARSAATAFTEALSPQDEVALLPFSTQVGKATPFTTDRAAITTALNGLVAKGNTALFDALYAAARLVSTSKQGNRRVVVLLTDGQDVGSRQAMPIGTAAAREANALVYTMGVGGDTDDQVMTLMAQGAGGRYSKAVNPADLQGLYTQLARELAGQYLLTYQSSTRVLKAYEIIRVKITYRAPSGELLTQEVRYRPPATSVVQEATPGPVATVVPRPQIPLPVGMPRPVKAAGVPAPAAVDTSSLRMFALLAGFLAALAVLLIFGAGVLLSAPTMIRGRLDRYVAARELAGLPGAAPTSFTQRVLLPMFDAWGGRLNALTPGSYVDQIQRLLYQAGPPYRMSRTGFLGLQAGIAIATAVLFVLLALANKAALLQVVLAAAFGVFVGAYIPYFLLTRRVTQRKKRLLRALPGALDFLAIMVEAGVGFDQALNELVRRWQNTLTDEFALLLVDFQIGKARREAWREMTLRTALPELNSFVVAMMQSEQTGASIGNLLRTQADQMRIRRRQRAEEEARMAPVKMLIPMALFIFPCILIVILGPAIPQIFGTLSNVGR